MLCIRGKQRETTFAPLFSKQYSALQRTALLFAVAGIIALGMTGMLIGDAVLTFLANKGEGGVLPSRSRCCITLLDVPRVQQESISALLLYSHTERCVIPVHTQGRTRGGRVVVVQ